MMNSGAVGVAAAHAALDSAEASLDRTGPPPGLGPLARGHPPNRFGG